MFYFLTKKSLGMESDSCITNEIHWLFLCYFKHVTSVFIFVNGLTRVRFKDRVGQQ